MRNAKQGNDLKETSVHRKSTNPGLLLHYHSHVDKWYKRYLLSTMINRAYRLSSTPTAFSEECDKLRTTFLNLNYPVNLILRLTNFCTISTIIVQNLECKIRVQMKLVFQSKKISQALSPKGKKSPIVNNQCVVYKFKCDLCDTDYVRYTTRHLHQRIGEHNILQLEDTWKTMAYRSPIWRTNNSLFWENVDRSLTA